MAGTARRAGRSRGGDSGAAGRYRAAAIEPQAELEALFDELDQLFKNPDVVASLTARGINASLAMTAADGLRAYLRGQKSQAAEDLGTVAEEILSRLAGDAPGTWEPS